MPGMCGMALTVAVLACTAYTAPMPAGAISAVEGEVTLNGQPVGSDVSEAPRANPGQVLGTGNGRAELLLNPGVFLRIGQNSSIKLIASSPDNTRIELLRGEALLEVLQLGKQEQLEIIDRQAYTRMLKVGLYVFHVDGPRVQVYEGKARVDDDQRSAAFGQGKQLTIRAKSPEPAKFDLTERDSLYDWSARRTRSIAQTSESMVENLLAFARGEQYDAGWYWNPWFRAWAYVPPEGYRISAFGYGFYSPDATRSVAPVFADFRP